MSLKECNPLVWWKVCAPTYKYLTKLVKRTLTITATSVPSERLFSSTGDLILEKISCLETLTCCYFCMKICEHCNFVCSFLSFPCYCTLAYVLNILIYCNKIDMVKHNIVPALVGMACLKVCKQGRYDIIAERSEAERGLVIVT